MSTFDNHSIERNRSERPEQQIMGDTGQPIICNVVVLGAAGVTFTSTHDWNLNLYFIYCRIIVVSEFTVKVPFNLRHLLLVTGLC